MEEVDEVFAEDLGWEGDVEWEPFVGDMEPFTEDQGWVLGAAAEHTIVITDDAWETFNANTETSYAEKARRVEQMEHLLLGSPPPQPCDDVTTRHFNNEMCSLCGERRMWSYVLHDWVCVSGTCYLGDFDTSSESSSE